MFGARVLSSYRRYRRGRVAALAVAAAAMVAVPLAASAASASPGAAGVSQSGASCPWVSSRAPVAQRVAQLMSQMSLADEITMVEGHGTTNPYVFYTPAIPALCIPAVGLEDGPAGVADGLTGVTQLPAGVALAATWDPWLSSVAGVVDAWYPGQTSGTSLASVLFGQTDPGGHLPVTFPSSLSQVPASTTAQFPGNGTTVQYSEGIDVGYRWYDARSVTPLFPFGFGLSYTQFAFSHLSLSRSTVDGTQDLRVSAVVTNTGHRSGSEVAQLYLSDPASTGEPPRELAGFQRVSLAPGQSARVSFAVTPQQESWWSDSANGWTQTAGPYGVYVGDSSALADLPLRGSFTMTSTPGARQVSVSAPSTMQAGKTARVRVTLSAAGDTTLHRVRLALQLPQGWKAVPAGPTVFGSVAPGQAASATFLVTPPSYAPNASAVVHATATMGDLQREAGVSVTVSG